MCFHTFAFFFKVIFMIKTKVIINKKKNNLHGLIEGIIKFLNKKKKRITNLSREILVSFLYIYLITLEIVRIY